MAVLLVVFLGSATAAVPTVGAWTNVYGEPSLSNASDPRHVQFLSDGSIVVVGTFTGEFNGLTAETAADGFVMRLSPEGALMWTKRWNDPSNDPTYVEHVNVVVLADDTTVVGAFERLLLISPDGVVSEVALGQGSYVRAMSAGPAGGFLTLEQNGNAVAIRDGDGTEVSTWTPSEGFTIDDALTRPDGAGGMFVLSRDPAIGLEPDRSALHRIDDSGNEIWSTLFNGQLIEQSYGPFGDEVLVWSHEDGSLGRTQRVSLNTGETLGLWDSNGSFAGFPGYCAETIDANRFPSLGNCNLFFVMRNWNPFRQLPDGKLITIGTNGEKWNGRGRNFADGVLTMDYSDGVFTPIVATELIASPNEQNRVTAVAVEPSTGRIAVVGRSNGVAGLLSPDSDPSDPGQAFAALNPGGHMFSDTPYEGWRNTAVEWMRESKVTTGCSQTEFCPERTMTREELITFLWRYQGSPSATAQNPFPDVERGRYFTTAIDWAAETRVTTGIPTENGPIFGTGRSVSRAEAVTMIWRAAGRPQPSAPSDFPDVPAAGIWYSDAVAWAAEVGVTTGYQNGQFGPADPVKRVEFAAFLQRFDDL